MDELKKMLQDPSTLRIAVDMWRRIAVGHEAEAKRLRAAIQAHCLLTQHATASNADKELWEALDAQPTAD